MHLGRFHAVINSLAKEIADRGLLKSLDQLIAALTAYANGPSDGTATAYKNALDRLVAAGDQSISTRGTPSQQALLDEVDGRRYIGNGLAASVTELLNQNVVTAQTAATQLQTFRKEANTFYEKVTHLSRSLDGFGVELEELEPGQIEFGVMFPKEAVGVELADLQKELTWLNRLFEDFNELIGQGRHSVTVRTISSTWWQFFVEQGPFLGVSIAISVERILAMMKTNLEIKKLQAELKKKDVPQQITELIDAHLASQLKQEVKAIVDQLAEKHDDLHNDKGRLNEVKVSVTIGLMHLAKRINQGGKVEVRALPPARPDPLAADASPEQVAEHDSRLAQYQEATEIAATINQAEENIDELLKLDVGETLLALEFDDMPPTESPASDAS